MGEICPVFGRIWVHILSSSCCPNGLISQESHCFFKHSVSFVPPNNCTETAHGIQPFTVNPSLLMPFLSQWILSIGVNNHIGRCLALQPAHSSRLLPRDQSNLWASQQIFITAVYEAIILAKESTSVFNQFPDLFLQDPASFSFWWRAFA